MPNAFIELLDSGSPIATPSVLKALAEVPFVQHQFRWLVARIFTETPEAAVKTMVGYTGVKKMSESRMARLVMIHEVIRGMSISSINDLPPAVKAGAPIPIPVPVPSLEVSANLQLALAL